MLENWAGKEKDQICILKESLCQMSEESENVRKSLKRL